MTAALAVLLAGTLLHPSAGPSDQAAPFGFSWGPVVKVPRPSHATREDNVTLLLYQRDRLPEVKDTDRIVLEVCKNEGLQQIVWISRFLSEAEEREKFEAIVAEGTRRHGKPEILEREIMSWSAGGTVMARISTDEGRRIVMVSTGPGFSACSEQHKSHTGHPMSDHWMRFLPDNAK
jgi:hypothetical protein